MKIVIFKNGTKIQISDHGFKIIADRVATGAKKWQIFLDLMINLDDVSCITDKETIIYDR